jgi:hypothetical protein
MFIILNTRIIHITNNYYDKCYIKLLLDQNLKKYDVHASQGYIKKQFFFTQKSVPWYKQIHPLCLISLHYCKYSRLKALPIATQVKE